MSKGFAPFPALISRAVSTLPAHAEQPAVKSWGVKWVKLGLGTPVDVALIAAKLRLKPGLG